MHFSRMMVSEEPVLFTARSGARSIKVKGVPYHSAYDPVREAEKFCSALRVEDTDVILLFGWGLGYCGDVIRPRLKSTSRVIVFEPDAALFEIYRGANKGRQALDDARFQFVVGEDQCRIYDGWDLDGRQETDRFLWLEWPAAVALHKELLDHVKARFKVRLRDKAANLLTHFQRGSLYFENALSNFRFQESADIGALFKPFKNIPLVIVSAGPSLDSNIENLRGMEDRCFILAVDTALRPLLAAGVTPHAVIVADPSEVNARHVVGVIPDSTYLIAEQAVQPAVLESGPRRFLFGLGLFPDPLFAEFGFVKTSLYVWGSVATAALDLACRMRANPVIIVGQDFAYSGNRAYASNTIYEGFPFDAEKSGPLKELDIRGDYVRTSENLIAYRDSFTRTIKQQHGIRFINATEGGILRDGVEILPLRTALQRGCPKPLDVARRLRDSYRVHPISTKALRHFRDVLKTERRNCGCLAAFLELVAKQELLNRDFDAIKTKIQWGIEFTEQTLVASGQPPLS